MRITTFLSNDSGAVTVDWVVLTGSVVGLGLATMAVVSGGVENLSTDTANSLASQSASGNFGWGIGGPTILANTDFTNGDMGGWVGGQVMAPIEELGEMLVLGPFESTSLTLDVPEGADSATLTFDLIGGDSLDNEVATIATNGTTVTLARGLHNGTMTFTTPDIDGVTVTTEVISEGTNIGGASPASWRDSVTRVSVTVDDPGTELALGVQSGANQHIGDEFFGIDNVEVSSQ